MAQKHKSKYKAPKDLEKSQKPKTRKDLTDYTLDDKDGGMNPKSTKEKQLNVLRKTDKETVDTGDMYVKYNADDRLYKDLEDGEWEPKHAAKVLKKRQDADEKDNEKNIKDKIENLTREQKERLVREYIRRKIYNVLIEQEEPTEEEPAAEPKTPETPAAEPETTETPAEETPAADTSTDTPAETPVAATSPAPTTPDAPATPTTEPAAETPAEAPAEPAAELSPETKEALAIEKFVKQLKADGGNIARIKTLAKVFNMVMKEAEPEDKHNFYKLLRQLSIKKLSTIDNIEQPKTK